MSTPSTPLAPSILKNIWQSLLSKRTRDAIYRLRLRTAFRLAPDLAKRLEAPSLVPPLPPEPLPQPEIQLITLKVDDSPPHHSTVEAWEGMRVLYRQSELVSPVLLHRTEESVLDDTGDPDLVPFEVAGRKRLATCSGLAWFAGNHLAAVNLYGQHLRIYRMEKPSDEGGEPRLELLHEFTEGIHYPEAVSASSDGKLFAVSHSLVEKKGVTLHRADPFTFKPEPEFTRLDPDETCHGLEFSPNARYLAYTCLTGAGSVHVVDVTESPVKRTCFIANRNPDLRPKAVTFTPDGKYVAIVYSPIVQATSDHISQAGRIEIRRFDSRSGSIDGACEAVLESTASLLVGLELAVFGPLIAVGQYRLFVANQAHDLVLEILFDAVRMKLTVTGKQIRGLPFPHGVSVSRDGRFFPWRATEMTRYGSFLCEKTSPDAPGIPEFTFFSADTQPFRRFEALNGASSSSQKRSQISTTVSRVCCRTTTDLTPRSLHDSRI